MAARQGSNLRTRPDTERKPMMPEIEPTKEGCV